MTHPAWYLLVTRPAVPLGSARVSFDLYFLSPRPGETWDGAMARLEAAATEKAAFDDADLARWDSVQARVAVLLPDAETFQGRAHRELSDDATGIQVSLSPGELSLTVPYWYSGPDAQRLTALLRSVVLAIEEETGLTAYDPQAAAPFIGSGDAAAAETFNRVHDVLASQAGSANAAESTPPPGSRQKRFSRKSR
jgi:hypothetical protein